MTDSTLATAALPPIIANCARCGAVDHTTAGHDAARPTTTAAPPVEFCARSRLSESGDYGRHRSTRVARRSSSPCAVSTERHSRRFTGLSASTTSCATSPTRPFMPTEPTTTAARPVNTTVWIIGPDDAPTAIEYEQSDGQVYLLCKITDADATALGMFATRAAMAMSMDIRQSLHGDCYVRARDKRGRFTRV